MTFFGRLVRSLRDTCSSVAASPRVGSTASAAMASPAVCNSVRRVVEVMDSPRVESSLAPLPRTSAKCNSNPVFEQRFIMCTFRRRIQPFSLDLFPEAVVWNPWHDRLCVRYPGIEIDVVEMAEQTEVSERGPVSGCRGQWSAKTSSAAAGPTRKRNSAVNGRLWDDWNSGGLDQPRSMHVDGAGSGAAGD